MLRKWHFFDDYDVIIQQRKNGRTFFKLGGVADPIKRHIRCKNQEFLSTHFMTLGVAKNCKMT